MSLQLRAILVRPHVVGSLPRIHCNSALTMDFVRRRYVNFGWVVVFGLVYFVYISEAILLHMAVRAFACQGLYCVHL